MNRTNIIIFLKKLSKNLCISCEKKDYENCVECVNHILINGILDELDGK